MFSSILEGNRRRVYVRPCSSHMTESLSVDGYLAAILTHAQDAILFINARDEIFCWNPAAERLFGYSEQDAVGRGAAEFIVPHSSCSEFKAMVEAARAGDRAIRRELRCCRADGSLVRVELTLVATRNQERKVCISAIARDIDGQKRLEEALRNSEKLAATGRLAASIAHEINNPLESVSNLLYLMEKECALDDHTRQYVRMAEQEVGRIVHITRQTLGFYRESSAPVVLRIAELLENVLELYAPRIRSRRIRVEKRFGHEPGIRGFPGEMRQVFSNLVVNALEAVGDDGEVKLHVFESCDWHRPQRRGVRVVIADKGPGIAREQCQHIFEPFYTTKGERGTGLGLWLSRDIIRKHRGRIRVRSSVQPGRRGTVFSIFLPAESQQPMAKSA